MKVRSYGVSGTTLEEIFLKLADDEQVMKPVPAHDQKNLVEVDLATSRRIPQQAESIRPSKGDVSPLVKLFKLCKIRFLLCFRSKLSLVFQLLLPILLVILNGLITQEMKGAAERDRTANFFTDDEIAADFKRRKVKLFSNWNLGDSQYLGQLEKLSSMDEKFEQLSYADLETNYPHYVGFRFRKSDDLLIPAITIIYNATATHSVPYAVNLALSAAFRMVTNRSEKFILNIFPLPNEYTQTGLNFNFDPILIGLALSVIPGIFCVDVCRDRTLRIRSQIRMTGCSAWLYWGSAFLSHFIQYAVSFGLIVAVMYAFDMQVVTKNMGYLIILFLLHAPAMILFCYCLNFAFRRYQDAMASIPLPLALVRNFTFLNQIYISQILVLCILQMDIRV